MADLRALEDLILAPLSAQLEAALELVTAADAMTRLQEVAELCRQAQVLATAGVLLQQPDA